MKQNALASGNISGGTAGSSVLSETVWQGGNGWLVVQNFSQISGSPVLNITATAAPGFGVSLPGIPTPITAAGVFQFHAPKDVSIFCEVVAQPGEQVSFSNINFLGDA